MCRKLIDKLKLDDLKDDQKEMAELIGIENYKKLVYRFGGCPLYVYKEDTLIKDIRDKEIIKNFNGDNYKELAIEYNLSERTIRELVFDKQKDINGEQISLLDLCESFVK